MAFIHSDKVLMLETSTMLSCFSGKLIVFNVFYTKLLMFHFPTNVTLYFLYKLHPSSLFIHAAIQG